MNPDRNLPGGAFQPSGMAGGEKLARAPGPHTRSRLGDGPQETAQFRSSEEPVHGGIGGAGITRADDRPAGEGVAGFEAVAAVGFGSELNVQTGGVCQGGCREGAGNAAAVAVRVRGEGGLQHDAPSGTVQGAGRDGRAQMRQTECLPLKFA